VAILQALISYLSKSAGKALNAIFGWAVVALFGQTSPKEQTVLSAVVAAAAVWPLLLLGVIVPKIALLVIAFVPLGKSVPGFWLRIVWITLAIAVPIVVGTVVAKRGSQESLPEPGWKRLLRGFPITLALACAFLLMLVVAPILRIAHQEDGGGAQVQPHHQTVVVHVGKRRAIGVEDGHRGALAQGRVLALRRCGERPRSTRAASAVGTVA